MNPDTIAANLALVEGHFHSERTNEIETALELYTDDIVWEGPGPPTGRPAASSHLSAEARVVAAFVVDPRGRVEYSTITCSPAPSVPGIPRVRLRVPQRS